MFSPAQVQLWRRSVASEPQLRQFFEGRKLQRFVVTFGKPDLRPLPPPATLGQLRKPIRVFGNAFDSHCMDGIGAWDIHSRPNQLQHLRNAVILGNSAVLTEERDLLTPFRCNDLIPNVFVERNAYGHQGFLFEELDGTSVALYCADQPLLEYHSQRGLFLPNIEPGNYGSFFFRVLPQLLQLQSSLHEFSYYIVPERTSFLIEAINMLGLPEKPLVEVREVIGQPLRELSMFTFDDAEGFIDPTTRHRLVALANQTLQGRGGDTVSTRFYISRRLSAIRRPWYRVIQNEDELEVIARNAGFEVIYPETLTLRQQLANFANGTVFAGPSGSGMFNIGFARNPSRVLDIETHHVTVRQHAKFYASLGADYSFLFADLIDRATANPIVAPSICDTKLFREGLEWLYSG